MQISEVDQELFFLIRDHLLIFVHNQTAKNARKLDRDSFYALPIEKQILIRNTLYKKLSLIDQFKKENPANLSNEQLSFVDNWKRFKPGEFLVIQHLKKYSLFFGGEDGEEEDRVYAVLSLRRPLTNFIPVTPIMVKAVLLPWRDKIIYDSYLEQYSITFGAGFRKNMKSECQEVQAKYGLITSFDMVEKGNSDEDLLRFYIKNEENRQQYSREIDEILDKNPKLEPIYHYELNKGAARSYGRRLQHIGVNSYWFAIIDSIIIASAASKDRLEEIVQKIVPKDKLTWVYYYQFKKK
ncbi:MAG: hypothetical protein K0S74_780 [Chlamydiales bacterium]|jgi:hypothetical protein|nr:hypothetical protein [Chlamydiales bacterium]